MTRQVLHLAHIERANLGMLSAKEVHGYLYRSRGGWAVAQVR